MTSRAAFCFQTSNADVQELSLKAQSIFNEIVSTLNPREVALLFDLEELVSSMMIASQN